MNKWENGKFSDSLTPEVIECTCLGTRNNYTHDESCPCAFVPSKADHISRTPKLVPPKAEVSEWEKEWKQLKEDLISVKNNEWWSSDEDYIKAFIARVRNQALEEAALLLSKNMPTYIPFDSNASGATLGEFEENKKKNLDIQIQNHTLVSAQSIIRSLKQ